MVNGYIKESLDLVGVQVHRDHTVHASSTQQVGNELGTDAHTGFVLTILTGPSEVGDDGVDGAG